MLFEVLELGAQRGEREAGRDGEKDVKRGGQKVKKTAAAEAIEA